ncbi:MAG: hemerythrin domain-containing protein [Undibacterium sp.]|jgi:hemerythrin-like domain-containing protein|nr:hemerythrin domain-containing protein [Undibacterium sp.]MDO8701848.1 hemerythrin domain-containing protein [Undibacterium sp.]MDO9194696.1 hemerythrin domain-containing protein [Undibacterium sp.]
MSVRNIHPIALDIIQKEHEHLSAVLQGMLHFVREIQSGNDRQDLKLLRAMLYYINEYPERVHHPKEDQILFAKIKERTHQLDNELDAVSEQHGKGELLAHRLQDALLRYEFGGQEAFAHLHTLVEQYAHFYFAHMRAEEERILPVAKQVLNDADWKVVDAAFVENQNNLDKTGQRYKYDLLFAQICSVAPI